MHRFFVPPQNVHGSTITVQDPRELHHIRDVLRLGLGAQVVCFDGTGQEYHGTITEHHHDDLTVHIDQRVVTNAPGIRLWLAQAIPKAPRFDWIIEKVTELGIWRVSPLLTRHTVVRLAGPQAGRNKEARWQRVAQAAAKQCGRTTVPLIDSPQSLEAFLPLVEGSGLMVMPTLAVSAIPLREVLAVPPPGSQVTVLIGPEGDFTGDEVALAERHGARPVSLGPLTLRAETAAIATLAIVQYALAHR